MIKQCEICGKTDGKIYGAKSGRWLCNRHYTQLKVTGSIKDRTRIDPNELVVNGDTTEIILYNIKNTEVGRALIDTNSIDVIKAYKWNYGGGYVEGIHNGHKIALHRLVTGDIKGMFVDHINHNPLDNRLNNLRICTCQENTCNQVVRVDNSTGHKGIRHSKTRGKWEARIQVKGRGIHLGTFADINDAIAARKVAEEKYFGEFAYNPEAQYGT